MSPLPPFRSDPQTVDNRMHRPLILVLLISPRGRIFPLFTALHQRLTAALVAGAARTPGSCPRAIPVPRKLAVQDWVNLLLQPS